MRLGPVRPRRAYSGWVARREDSSIPTGRIRRTAQVGTVVGSQGARYAKTRAANLARSPEQASEALEQRHLEAAERMVETLGRMKGAAMKVGQLASFIDTEFLPPEYRELYQEQLASLRSTAPPMPWEKVRAVLDEEWAEPVEELFDDFEHDAAAAASLG
jgi:predicted unusual protein kinase regulating ubiquinone biosynthesis (AarF/ABC1/UbiB family)